MQTPTAAQSPLPLPLLPRRASSGEIRNLAAVSSSLLPAFGTLIDDTYPRLRRYIIAPYDRRYRWWQLFLILLVLYSAWVSPFELAFQHVASGSLLYPDLVVDCFFAIDIVVTFFVAYLDKSSYLLVDHPKKIATRYMHKATVASTGVRYTSFQDQLREVESKVLLGGIASFDKLRRMGFHGPSLCFLCCQDEESSDHLFFSCTFSAWIWMEVLKRLGLHRRPKDTIHLEVDSLLGSFWRKGVGTSVCFIAIRASVWWIWKERCTRIFNDSRRSKMQVLLSILRDVQSIAQDRPSGVGCSGRERTIAKNFNIEIT